jgi:Zn-dependent protease
MQLPLRFAQHLYVKIGTMLDILFQSPLLFALFAAIFVLALSIHEWAHAYAAYKLGDPTAKYEGRLTLNPAAHLDFMGTLLIILVGVGWGKPVPVNTANFKNPRRDAAIVAFAGPLSNILTAIFLALVIHFINLSPVLDTILYSILVFSLRLAFFNLLPIAPLDGASVVFGILPVSLIYQWQQIQSYGFYILLLLIMTGTTGFFIFPLTEISLRLLGF